MEDVLIVFAIVASIFGIVFIVITARNRERLSMIEKGINPLEYKPKTNNGGLLKWSLLIIGLGLGFFVGNLVDTATEMNEEAAYFGSIMFFGGLGLLLAYLMSKKATNE